MLTPPDKLRETRVSRSCCLWRKGVVHPPSHQWHGRANFPPATLPYSYAETESPVDSIRSRVRTMWPGRPRKHILSSPFSLSLHCHSFNGDSRHRGALGGLQECSNLAYSYSRRLRATRVTRSCIRARSEQLSLVTQDVETESPVDSIRSQRPA